MRFYTRGKKRRRAQRKRAAIRVTENDDGQDEVELVITERTKEGTIVLTAPITPCDDKMKETAVDVAEEREAGLDQD